MPAMIDESRHSGSLERLRISDASRVGPSLRNNHGSFACPFSRGRLIFQNGHDQPLAPRSVYLLTNVLLSPSSPIPPHASSHHLEYSDANLTGSQPNGSNSPRQS